MGEGGREREEGRDSTDLLSSSFFMPLVRQNLHG